MQPNPPSQFSPPPQPPTSTEPSQLNTTYLDQIAAPVTQKTVSPVVLWGAIGGILLVLGIVVMMILNSGGPTHGQRLATLVERINAVKALTTQSQRTIRSGQLRSINSALSITLSNTSRDSAKPLEAANQKLDPAKKSPELTSELDKMKTRLENARLNNVYDRVYAREIAYQVSQTRTELKNLAKSSSSKSLKEFAGTTEKNLAPLNAQLTTFNNAQD